MDAKENQMAAKLIFDWTQRGTAMPLCPDCNNDTPPTGQELCPDGDRPWILFCPHCELDVDLKVTRRT